MTDNHDYNTPSKGTTDWHNPLNTNFEDIDADIEIRDTTGNRGSYTPASGAKFLATDTGVVSLGDGSSWSEAFALPRYKSSSNLVAGHPANEVSGGPTGIEGATISGGGSSSNPNTVTLDFGTVGGGFGNEASGSNATVAGGEKNTAGGISSVVGGGKNIAGERAATVAGGNQNHATGAASMVPGGEENRATGKYSFAAGR